MTIIVMWLICLAPGCASDEKKAERLYREAKERVEENDLIAAIEELEALVESYPLTPAAQRAERDLVLYRGLVRAEHQYPVDNAHKLIVRVARAIERYRSRNRTWPQTLDDLRPDLLREAPVDPWGRVLRYQAKKGGGYVLMTLGADGAVGGTFEDKDFFVEDGEFVKQPSLVP